MYGLDRTSLSAVLSPHCLPSNWVLKTLMPTGCKNPVNERKDPTGLLAVRMYGYELQPFIGFPRGAKCDQQR